MKLLVLNSTDLNRLLDLDELRLRMKVALVSLSLKQSENIPKQVASPGEGKDLGFMPFVSIPMELMGYKAVSVFSGNSNRNLNPRQGIVALLDFETGELRCIAEGSTVTALRTAAVSAVATDLLSRKDSKVLAVVGAGKQAFEHIRAISRVRDLQEILIFNRDRNKAEHLIARLAPNIKVPMVVTNSASDAIRDADIVTACTASREPIFRTSGLKPGIHINAIGSCMPGFREVEIHFNQSLGIFLDNHSACLVKADEIFGSVLGDQAFPSIVGEVGEALAGLKPGRTSDQEITLFKSVGLAIEDIFTVELAYRHALTRKEPGKQIDFPPGA